MGAWPNRNVNEGRKTRHKKLGKGPDGYSATTLPALPRQSADGVGRAQHVTTTDNTVLLFVTANKGRESFL